MPYAALPSSAMVAVGFLVFYFGGALRASVMDATRDRPKRRHLNSEYFFQLDRRDDFIRQAKSDLSKGSSEIRGVEVFESRKKNYTKFENAFNTYRIPSSNPYLKKV
mmetsp:Transcript_5651/g.8589  ORF Transcript_5651/g.8589 Transcript_5651/m.8589 type:complete len:107 (-) Transcript_5651:87-407(-)|eukprot:CAMPEP_0185024444 /NCGR_PEP_ID=MMETSP1103-20130426/7518_1 /TAXON_ID=36769 /ORGANISM="Paraphysomonas bandaiensis, Strain Caron Lab Isolate" /LENGTH=106 /DNA_ID=CAMNT_0027557415 /DNA_START=115 /DNA_END=435 /DNA_ORIENTATION=+